MKSFIITLSIILVTALLGCKNGDNSQTNNSNEIMPFVHIETTTHNFGKILQGEEVAYTFIIKNIGNDDLILRNVKSSCGCTTSKVTTEPIKPGHTGSVELVFDSTGRKGKQTKSVTVWTNAKPMSYNLKITAEIVLPNN